jgi:hypothetical protein
VLPLPYYDMIVGMDWLQSHSPMKIDWVNKWMHIRYAGEDVQIHGLYSSLPELSVIEVFMVQDEVSDAACLVQTTMPEFVQQLLDSFQHLFAEPNELPPRRAYDHSIPLRPRAQPVNVRPYRFPPAMKDEVEKQIIEMVSKGIIQHIQSSFSSPVLMVKKKDRTRCFYVDYMYLNALTVKSKYQSLSLMSSWMNCMWHLGSVAWTPELGFHQILLQLGEEFKTAFQTHIGHFEFRVMAFGLTGALGTFYRTMNTTLHPLFRKCVIVFFDDILVYNSSLVDHLYHLQQVFELMSPEQWKIKLSKCLFAQNQVTYLGHAISQNGVAIDSSKISAISSWSTPTNLKELRSFLGLAGYYRKFVRHFGIICQPLNALLKYFFVFVWTQQHQTTFEALKQVLISAPVLALPNFTKPFAIETYASDSRIRAVLMHDGQPWYFRIEL